MKPPIYGKILLAMFLLLFVMTSVFVGMYLKYHVYDERRVNNGDRDVIRDGSSDNRQSIVDESFIVGEAVGLSNDSSL